MEKNNETKSKWYEDNALILFLGGLLMFIASIAFFSITLFFFAFICIVSAAIMTPSLTNKMEE